MTTTPRTRRRSPATTSSTSTRRRAGAAPLLSVFGGKITTYRKLAEHALDELAPFFPGLGPAWTAARSAAGRRHAGCRFRGAGCARSEAALPVAARRLARHYGRLYGTRADAAPGRRPRSCRISAGISAPLLYEREARFLVARGMGADCRGHPRAAHQARPPPSTGRRAMSSQMVAGGMKRDDARGRGLDPQLRRRSSSRAHRQHVLLVQDWAGNTS